MTSPMEPLPPEPPPHEEPADPPVAATLPSPPQVSRSRLVTYLTLGAALLGGLYLVGRLPRARQEAQLEQQASATLSERPHVDVVHPKLAAAAGEVTIPASLLPIIEATIYARVDGYVKRRLVDIGDEVKEGQLLAELDTPELDHQLGQAKATVEQSRASVRQAQAQATYERQMVARYQQLVPSGLAAQQDLDQHTASLGVDEANVAAAQSLVASNEANVKRLADLKAFSNLIAPFAGTITGRYLDVGALINAGSNQQSAIFKLAKTDVIRILPSVPQSAAPLLQVGSEAKVTVREFPGRTFVGVVTRSATALDEDTHTMTVEVQIKNPDHTLLAGMYANVHLPSLAAHPSFLVPTSALLTGPHGTQLAVVDPEQRVHLRSVLIGDDLGTTLNISEGLHAEDLVIANPGERLTEGQLVISKVRESP